ncbi:MAG: hypothetical protein ACRD2W_11840, partial [Acidimicrobiales bacterium]
MATLAALVSLVAFGQVLNPVSGAAQEKTPATTVVPPPPADVLADPLKPAPAIAGPSAPPAIAAEDLPPVDKADPVAVAVDQARRLGRRVEVTAARTETVTTYANPDGTLTTEIAGGPVRVSQGTGFVPVDPTLVSAGGAIAPRAAKGSVKFSAGGAAGGELASLASDASRLALKWPGALPAPTLAGNTATYRDVAPGQDLVVKATTTGFESFVVLRSAPKAAPVIRIPVALQNLSLTQEAGGALRLAGGGGTKDIVVP